MKTYSEAAQNALKIRGANDWFGHVPSPTNNIKIANGNEKPTGLWFAQAAGNQNGIRDTRPKTAGRTALSPEADNIKTKIKESEGNWYKQLETSPVVQRSNSRIRSNDASTYSSRNTARESMEWYKSTPAQDPNAKTPRTPSKQSAQNLTKQRPSGIPNWYKSEKNDNDKNERPVSRCKSRDAQVNLKKNRVTNDWILPNSPNKNDYSSICRLKSPEAKEFKKNFGKDSEQWYKHDENNNIINVQNDGKSISNGSGDDDGKSIVNGSGTDDAKIISNGSGKGEESINILKINHEDPSTESSNGEPELDKDGNI